MKKIILLFGAVAFMSTASMAGNHNESDLKINTEVSKVEWVGKKVAGEHTGNISLQEGSLHLHNGTLTSGTVIMNMESITCTDLEGDWSKKLVGHLNSADFFDVQNHKTAKLEIKSFKLVEGNKYMVSGELTIKGITKAISFPVTVEMEDGKLAAYAEMSIDRTLYDIKYGSGKFFEGLGDKMIDDNFIVKFKIAAS